MSNPAPQFVLGHGGRRIRVLYPSNRPSKKALLAAMKLYAATLPSGKSAQFPPGSGPYRFLVQTIGGIGNTLMSTPLIAELRRLYPQAQIDVLTSAAGASLLSTNTHPTRVLVDPTTSERPRKSIRDNNLTAYRDTIRSVRGERYDACFLALNSIDLKGSLRPVLARIPVRVIHAYRFVPCDDFTHLFTHRVPYVVEQHDCACNLDLLRAFAGDRVEDVPMVLPVPEAVDAQAVELLESKGWSKRGRTVGICPGCREWMVDKRWPITHFTELVKRVLADTADTEVLAFCGPHDQKEAAHLRGEIDDARFHVVDGMSLSVYSAALRQCDAVVTNDSLPLHMCSALGVPVVALFGPTNATRVGPWKVPSAVVKAPCDYTPYFEMPYFCDVGAGDPAMSAITVESVYDALTTLPRRS